MNIKSRTVDVSSIPPNLEITDIGLSNPANSTKVTIKEPGWGSKLVSDLLPTLIGTILFVAILFFLMTRM